MMGLTPGPLVSALPHFTLKNPLVLLMFLLDMFTTPLVVLMTLLVMFVA